MLFADHIAVDASSLFVQDRRRSTDGSNMKLHLPPATGLPNDNTSTPQNDSILSQIKNHLLNLGLGGGHVRQRSNSLPADVSRHSRPSYLQPPSASDLVHDMQWLSLDVIEAHPYLQQPPLPRRSYSAPTSSSSTSGSRFPEVASFAPHLVGVREMLLAPIQRLSMPNIEVSWRNIFGGWREPAKVAIDKPAPGESSGTIESEDDLQSVVSSQQSEDMTMEVEVEPDESRRTQSRTTLKEQSGTSSHVSETEHIGFVTTKEAMGVSQGRADPNVRPQPSEKASRRKQNATSVGKNTVLEDPPVPTTRTLRSRSILVNVPGSQEPECFPHPKRTATRRPVVVREISGPRSNPAQRTENQEATERTEADAAVAHRVFSKKTDCIGLPTANAPPSPRKTRSRTRTASAKTDVEVAEAGTKEEQEDGTSKKTKSPLGSNEPYINPRRRTQSQK